MPEYASSGDYERSPHSIDYGMEVDNEYIGGPDTDVPDLYLTTGIYSDQVSLVFDEERPADDACNVRELRNQYDELAQTVAGPLAKVQAAVAARGESFDEIFSQYAAVYAAENSRKPHDYEQELLKIDILSQTTTELDHDDIAGLIDEAGTPLAEACAIEEALLPPVVQTLIEIKDKLLRTTDWDMVIANAVAKQDYALLDQDIVVVAGEQHYDDYGLQEALARTEYVTLLQQEVIERGDRLPDGDVYHVPDGEQYAATLPDDINRWSQQTRAATVALSNARRSHIAHIDPYEKLERIYAMATTIGLGNADSTMVAPEIAHALHAHAEALIEEFEAADTAWVREFIEQTPRDVTIENGELVVENIGILNVSSWLQDRLHRYPVHMTSGLRGVRFLDDQAVDIVDGKEVHTVGMLGFDDGIAEVNIRSRSLADAHDTLDHEIWHNIEKNMTLAELREWAQICVEEQGTACDFIPGNIEPDMQNSESLAYCGEVYMNEPLNLLERGLHRRFAFLQAQVGRYQAEDIRLQTTLIDLNGHVASNIAEANRTLVRAADRVTEQSWQRAA
jgi:hypothetical protein